MTDALTHPSIAFEPRLPSLQRTSSGQPLEDALDAWLADDSTIGDLPTSEAEEVA